MQADPTKPILKLDSPEDSVRQPGHGNAKPSRTIEAAVQGQRLGPKFQRLRDFLDGPAQPVQGQPDGLAPERLLVFEVTGSVTDFVKAVAKVQGLTFAGEDLLDPDELDDDPQVYLLVPNLVALRQIVLLWQTWQRGADLPYGFAPWRQLFLRLRDIRPWGPRDRVRSLDQSVLADEAEAALPGELIRLECELVFRRSNETAQAAVAIVRAAITESGGQVVSEARHADFDYHAFLVDLPREEVARIAALQDNSLAGLDPVLSIMPQSRSTMIEPGEGEQADAQERPELDERPIAAIFDAVPLQSHSWIANWLNVSDPHDLETLAVGPRVHGTAMASIVVHGDRNAASSPIGKKLYFRAVMYAPAPDAFGNSRERFVDDRLVIDLMVEAVRTMRDEGYDQIVVVNLSLGDPNKQYRGRVSAWARAIDYLSFRYGVLFIVSSGNVGRSLQLDDYPHPDNFRASTVDLRKSALLRALDMAKADRRLLAPAESVNALSVGAWHRDSLDALPLPNGRYVGFPECDMPNVSSALGHGHKSAVKPDVLFPGGREHLILAPINQPVNVRPNPAGTRFGGIRVAAPNLPGQPLDYSAWTIGSSASAAYATHTAHQIYEALEREYGDIFVILPNSQKAALLKALLAHPATWNTSDEFIIATKFPVQANWDQMRREVSRHLGYGFVWPPEAMSCAADRATLWAAGRLLPQAAVEYRLPVPNDFSGTAALRSVKVTLAWLSPTRPGHQSYRASKLRIIPLSDNTKSAVGVSPVVEPPWTQTEAGTLIHRRWSGQAFGHLPAGSSISLQIQREKDQGPALDDAIPYGLAVTVTMEDNAAIYDEILSRVVVKPRSKVQV
ncbi:S8 family peptidase [Labrys neptuniae]